MKYYSWEKLFLRLMLCPRLLISFLFLPRQYTSMEQWLKIDGVKCKIMAKAIGCDCSRVLWEQQRRNMEYRATIAKNFDDWMQKIKATPTLGNPIGTIVKEFEILEKCHRQYRSPGAGVYCFCKKHSH